MAKGYIYIMTNPCLKDMVKIGYATNVEEGFLAISMNTISILGHISISSLMRGKTLQNAIWSSSTP